VRVTVRQRGGDNKWRHPRYKQAISHYARTLRIPNPKELHIFLKLSADKRLVKENTYGRAKQNGPNTYTITIFRDLPWTSALKTLAHEMVHVHQFSTGKLKESYRDGAWHDCWENGEWTLVDSIPYCQRPWEKDARSKEQTLCESFFKVEDTSGRGTYNYGGNND
jgi:hypothetical protein